MITIFWAYALAWSLGFYLVGFESVSDTDPHSAVPIAVILSLVISALIVRQIVSEYHRDLANFWIYAPSAHHRGVEEWTYRLLLDRETDFRSLLPPEWFQTARFRWKDFFYQLRSFFVVASFVVWFFMFSSVSYYEIPIHPIVAFAAPILVTALLLALVKKTFFEGYDDEINVLDAMRDGDFLEWCHSNRLVADPANADTVIALHKRYVDYVNGEADDFMEWLEENGKSDADEGEMAVLYEKFHSRSKHPR